MKYSALFSLLIAAHRLAFATVPGADAPARHNILKWPDMNPVEFGCHVEETFDVKDKRFHCASKKPYKAQDNPCKSDAYSEGPAFPDAAASKVHPSIKSIMLTWEHGHLQGLSVEFKKKLSRAEIRRIFDLPADFDQPGRIKNIMTIDIQDCSKNGNCLGVSGFDHMGAADVDCEGAE